MKKLVFALAFSALTTLPAWAADLVTFEPAPFAPAALAYDWTGFYVGLQAGHGWSRVAQPWGPIGGPLTFPQDNADGKGWLGGAHVGYNSQFDSFVVGIEADLEASNIDGDDGGSGGHINGFRFNWLGSVRGRVGVSMDRLLIYGTGGYAFMNGTAYAVAGFGGAVGERRSAAFHGWTIGAGAEYAVTDNISVRGEYRYADFGARRVSFPVNGYDELIDPSLHAVRLGFSFKF